MKQLRLCLVHFSFVLSSAVRVGYFVREESGSLAAWQIKTLRNMTVVKKLETH